MDEIRRANADDLDVLVELCAEYCAADGHHFDQATVLAGLEPLLADDEHGVVLRAFGGRLNALRVSPNVVTDDEALERFLDLISAEAV